MTSEAPQSIPRLKLALWAGWRYYRRFATEYPQDFEQTAALLAWESRTIEDNKAAFRFITRNFSRCLYAYGYRPHPTAGWVAAGEYAAIRARHQCGCGKPAFYPRPDSSAWWCAACRAKDYRVRHPHTPKPREIKPPAGLRTWICGDCGATFEKDRHRMRADQAVYFCSDNCYYESRRKEVWRLAANAAIRHHAIEQFQARVINWPAMRADAAIRRGLSKPVTMRRGRSCWEATCRLGAIEFRVRLVRETDKTFSAVTVLESEIEKKRKRDARKRRRGMRLAA